MKRKNKTIVRTGYAIFCPTFFRGTVPACYDETNYPVVFPTELEAQREIADTQLTRIQEFLDGDREFDDAISTDEFVLPVNVSSDGHIFLGDGRSFGKID